MDHAGLWQAGSSSPTDLGVGHAYGINTSGQVVGTDINGHATLWQSGAAPIDLGAGVPIAINNNGQIVDTLFKVKLFFQFSMFFLSFSLRPFFS